MTRTSAAVSRRSVDGDTTVVAVPLGRHSDHSSTAVFVGESGLMFGDSAERRGLTQPDRLIREFKRRVGDDVPVVAGDQSFPAEQLFARVVTWVAETVGEREGQSPSGMTVTVPATWGEYRTRRVAAAIAHEGWRDVRLVTEPEAAARHYDHVNPLETGRALAIYDLGGGTFDAVVVRKDKKGALRVVSPSSGLPDVGGADFDDLLLRHVMTAAGISQDVLTTDPGSRVALAALRRECVDAKESLSFDSEAVIPVLFAGRSTSVRVTRAEFEGMIEAQIERTTEALEQVIEAASVRTDRLDAVLLVGGSSRIPRVAQLLSERIDTAIAVDADPKAVVAFGAARAAAAEFEGAEIPEERARIVVESESETTIADDLLGLEDLTHAPAPRPEQKSRIRWFGRGPATAAVAVGAVVLACGVALTGASAIAGGADAEAAPIFVAAGSGANGFLSDALDAESLRSIPSEPATETPSGADEPVPVLDVAAPSTPSGNSNSTASKSKSATRSAGKSADSTARSTNSNSNPNSNSNSSSATAPQQPAQSNGGGSNQSTNPAPQQPATPPPAEVTPDPVPEDPAPTQTDPPVEEPTPSDPPSEPEPTSPPAADGTPTETETGETAG